MTTRSHSTRLILLAAAVAVVGLGAACGGDDDDGGGGQTLTAENGRVTLVAEDNEWNADRIEIPADEPVTITVDNRDDGVSHNLNIKGTDFKTEIEKGPIEQRLEVELPADEYTYVCDVHSNMEGTLVAEEATDTTDTTG